MQLKLLFKVLLIIFSVALVVAGFFGYKIFLSPVTPEQESQFTIRKGWVLAQIGDSLASRGIIRNPQNFLAAAKLSRRAAQLKAGKYLIPPRSSNLELVKLFASGKAAREPREDVEKALEAFLAQAYPQPLVRVVSLKAQDPGGAMVMEYALSCPTYATFAGENVWNCPWVIEGSSDSHSGPRTWLPSESWGQVSASRK